MWAGSNMKWIKGCCMLENKRKVECLTKCIPADISCQGLYSKV
jgi:hypothetical protein